MNHIKTVIFDFGGVFTYSPFDAFDQAGAKLGAKPGQMHDIMLGGYGDDTDHPWHRLERGEITLEQCRNDILVLSERDYGFALDIYQVFADMPRDGGVRHELIKRVEQLDADGYQLAIITNNVLEIREMWRGLFNVEELFSLIIDSCEVGIRKPNPDIFTLTLERLGGIAPETTVFLDDFQGNIDTAKSLGMNTILVGDDIHQAIQELDNLLA